MYPLSSRTSQLGSAVQQNRGAVPLSRRAHRHTCRRLTARPGTAQAQCTASRRPKERLIQVLGMRNQKTESPRMLCIMLTAADADLTTASPMPHQLLSPGPAAQILLSRPNWAQRPTTSHGGKNGSGRVLLPDQYPMYLSRASCRGNIWLSRLSGVLESFTA